MLSKMPSCISRQHPKRFENQTNTCPRKWVNSTCRPESHQGYLQPCAVCGAATRDDAGLGEPAGLAGTGCSRGCKPAFDRASAGATGDSLATRSQSSSIRRKGTYALLRDSLRSGSHFSHQGGRGNRLPEVFTAWSKQPDRGSGCSRPTWCHERQLGSGCSPSRLCLRGWLARAYLSAVSARCSCAAWPQLVHRPLPDLLAPVPVVGFPRQHPRPPHMAEPHAFDVQ